LDIQDSRVSDIHVSGSPPPVSVSDSAPIPPSVPFIHISDIHVSTIHVPDIHVSVGPPISAVSDQAHLCVTEEEEEREEKTNQQTKENKDKDNDSITLSQYDVSMFSASDLFEIVTGRSSAVRPKRRK
jgi:hypothetical protein